MAYGYFPIDKNRHFGHVPETFIRRYHLNKIKSAFGCIISSPPEKINVEILGVVFFLFFTRIVHGRVPSPETEIRLPPLPLVLSIDSRTCLTLSDAKPLTLFFFNDT